MKKFYLFLSAALLGAGVASAEAPTLETVWQKYYTDFAFDSWNVSNVDWSKPEEITGGYGSRIGIGMNGKVYTLNCKTMSIMEVSEDGLKDVYQLPSLAGKTFDYNLMDEAFTPQTRSDYYGVYITRDDAGHFLIGHGFTTNAVPYLWTIYDPATKKAKSFQVPFTGNGDNTKYAMLRMDYIGRAMGNVLQDGGIAVGPTATTWETGGKSIKSFSWGTTDNVQRIKFINFYSETEGNTDVENVEAEGVVSDWIYLASKQGNICQPLYNSVEEFNAAAAEKGSMEAIKAGTFLYSKDAVNQTLEENEWTFNMGVYNGTHSIASFFDDIKATDFAKNYSSFASFDTFVLQGERYYVATFLSEKPTADNKIGASNNSFAVFDSKGKIVATQTINWYSASGWCSLSAEVVDDSTANIYLFGEAVKTVIPGVADTEGNYGVAGQYKFTAPATTGIADVAVDNEDAAPVYYNLQGVEVANPENGIYVVRRGSKVTKEVIR